ncbi:hypothetical protein ATANTOWER_017227 [Ataeniobius toweri]|uniref:Uncharacterized protein n=1 Tax=Ataeniobius toweri TaxID=208326 RepID=A0ABU7ABF9_9TELE|nr:hypothetical protein [Ataeniobius toweri]
MRREVKEFIAGCKLNLVGQPEHSELVWAAWGNKNLHDKSLWLHKITKTAICSQSYQTPPSMSNAVCLPSLTIFHCRMIQLLPDATNEPLWPVVDISASCVLNNSHIYFCGPHSIQTGSFLHAEPLLSVSVEKCFYTQGMLYCM